MLLLAACCCCLLLAAAAAKPGRSTLDTKKGYKTKTGSTSSVTLTLTGNPMPPKKSKKSPEIKKLMGNPCYICKKKGYQMACLHCNVPFHAHCDKHDICPHGSTPQSHDKQNMHGVGLYYGLYRQEYCQLPMIAKTPNFSQTPIFSQPCACCARCARAVQTRPLKPQKPVFTTLVLSDFFSSNLLSFVVHTF